MTENEMVEFVTAVESGDPLKDFFDEGQVAKWLYEMCLERLGMPPLSKRQDGAEPRYETGQE